MGMDAKAYIWLGISIEGPGGLNGAGGDTKAFGKLPKEVASNLEKVGKIIVDGITIRDFFSSEERVGLGVELFRTSWDHGVKPLELEALSAKAAELLPEVSRIFESWGISAKPRVLIATDFG